MTTPTRRPFATIALGALALLGADVALAAGVPVPFTAVNVPLASLGSSVTYTVDMGTLPPRPQLSITATPDPNHADMQLEVAITSCTLVGPNEFNPCSIYIPSQTTSTPKAGVQSVSFSPADTCDLRTTYPAYVGDTCEVRVRPLNFGSGGAPAAVNVAIRGTTDVPTSTVNEGVTGSTPVFSFLDTTTASYFSEGQNFRWIYDTNNDNVLVTPILGQCEMTFINSFGNNVNFTYQYNGSPTYHGLDCCAWQTGSTTGVNGAGQAIFYVNVDPALPANQPVDSDNDGIKNLCDNCPIKPNGPLLGSCAAGPRATNLCRSIQDCLGFPCSQAQEDANRTVPGDACVPEPMVAGSLATGLALVGSLERRRRAAANRATTSSRS